MTLPGLANRSPAQRSASMLTVVLVAGVAVVVGGLGWAVEHTSYDTWGAVPVGVGLLAVGLPLAATAARREDDRRVARLIVVALPLKMAMALVRFGVAFGLYDGATDAVSYDRAGELLAPMYRAGDFSAEVAGVPGTGFIEIVTGFVYSVTGPTKLGGYLAFSWLGFWGLYLFYRAFALACPEGDRWRYACLVFLLPSLLFWPSSIGKEAWMTLGLGIAAYGAARMLTHRRWGFVTFAAGMAATAMVRPHVTAIALAGLGLAYVFRRAPRQEKLGHAIRKLVGVTVLGLLLGVSLSQAEKLFGVDSFNTEAVVTVLREAQEQTSRDGSQFDLSQDTDLDPARFPSALVSVLFRPFPWEARNPQALIAGLEGLVLLGLFVAGWRRVVGALRSVLRTPYVILCVTYGVLFVFGFSSFANFGILTRQRVQVIPFLVVLLALPPFRGSPRDWRALLVEAPAPPPDERAREPVPV